MGPTVINRTWIEFYCEANTTETDTAARFEFRFLFDGVVARDVPIIAVSAANPKAWHPHITEKYRSYGPRLSTPAKNPAGAPGY